MLRVTILIALIVICANASAEKSGPFVNLGLSRAVVDLPDQQFEPFRRENDIKDLMGICAGIGYLFDSQLVTHFEGSAVESGFLGMADSYRLTHIDLSLGYRFRWKKMHFTPKIGYADWRLRAKEGAFLNPGVEESRAISGHDSLWGFSISYGEPHQQLVLSHKNIDTDFGGYDLSSIGLLISF